MEVHHDKLIQVPSTKYLIALCFALNMGFTQAATIRSPVAATASNQDPVLIIEHTIDHSGLFTNFINGVTDFDSYISVNPKHATLGEFFSPITWRTDDGVNTATVNYDLGAIFNIDRLAIWNEDLSGINNLDVLLSTDNSFFSNVLTGFTGLTNTPSNTDYPADVVDLGGVFSARYIRLTMQCPQSDAGFNGCGMGEFAVSDVGATSVPANTDYAWGALTLLASGMLLRRRSISTTTA